MFVQHIHSRWEVGEMVKPQCLEVFRGAGCSRVGDPFSGRGGGARAGGNAGKLQI